MAARQLTDSLKECFRREIKQAPFQVVMYALRIGDARHRGRRKNLLHLGREIECAAKQRIVERFDAEAIPRAEQPLLRAIPECEAPHSVKMLEALIAPLLVRAQDHFGVGPGSKAMSTALELYADLLVVVNLAVESDRVRTVFNFHRLVSSRGN